MFELTNKTYFDKAERSSQSELEQSISELACHPIISQMLESFPEPVIILDNNRQIIAYNKKAEEVLFNSNNNPIIGQRIGEALGCINAFKMAAGCGTSAFCAECGAGKCNKYTLETLKPNTDECSITVNRDGIESSLDLKVFTSILKVEDKNYLIFSIKNLESENRRQLLERIFFHDVLNTASIIFGITGMLQETKDDKKFEEYIKILQNSSEQLIQEIQSQRDLNNAEAGKLIVYAAADYISSYLTKAYDQYSSHHIRKGKIFNCYFPENDFVLETDPLLINRILGNLVKNALEAIEPGQKVTLTAEEIGENVRFIISNDGIMPQSVQMQIFKRSFSTKEKRGRGIGTYSVKLLTENYLNGKVHFISNEKEQTKFFIEIPKRFSSSHC